MVRAKQYLMLLGLLTCVLWATRFADAQSLCANCDVSVGVGATYHFWATTGGDVFPLTVVSADNDYEFGLFGFTTQQTLLERGAYRARLMANPYVGSSLSRRWTLLNTGAVRASVGFGLSYKSESDVLSVTRLDFASQFALRFRLLDGHIAEFAIRHWSNGGIRLPNHGQDFATLTILLRPRSAGYAAADSGPRDFPFNREWPP